MRHFVFCHGFGFNRRFWDHLAPYFAHESCSFIDLGYFSHPSPLEGLRGQSIIGIGHSLGLLKLMQSCQPFECLIGLNGFIHFLGHHPPLRHQRLIELEALKQHLVTNPVRTLQAFYQRCGVASLMPPICPEGLDVALMLSDLAGLHAPVVLPSTPTLIIASADDVVVPPCLIEDNFAHHPNVEIDMIQQGQHGLGVREPAYVYERIMSFLYRSRMKNMHFLAERFSQNQEKKPRISNDMLGFLSRSLGAITPTEKQVFRSRSVYMTNPRDTIRANFNRASRSYDAVATVQQKAARFLVRQLVGIQPAAPKTVLDLGAGTGYITERLLSVYPESVYLLNDLSERMLEVCKRKWGGHPNCAFLPGDMTALPMNRYDLIISNLALQWVDNLWEMIETCYAHSTASFAFSTLLAGTFQIWYELLTPYAPLSPPAYPTCEALAHFCQNMQGDHRFTYWTMDVPLTFSTPLLFMHYLKQLGASGPHHQLSASTLKALLRDQNQPLTVSYKIFFGIFKKGTS